jgi:D-cysteine desulfhydrase
LTAAAAAREGLKCRLVIEERVADSYDPLAGGNNFLYGLLGVEAITVAPAGADITAAMAEIVQALAGEGRKAYVIPVGGSNAVGALGYAACAQEIAAQMFDASLSIDHIVCASGSGGTHAGLLAGLAGLNIDIPLTGISVGSSRPEQERKVFALSKDVADLLGFEGPRRKTVEALDDWIGPGYSAPSPEMVDAVRTLAAVEGVLLDPVYTGKAMAGLFALVHQGRWQADQRVLFVHTGGSPALHVYQDVLRPAA